MPILRKPGWHPIWIKILLLKVSGLNRVWTLYLTGSGRRNMRLKLAWIGVLQSIWSVNERCLRERL